MSGRAPLSKACSLIGVRGFQVVQQLFFGGLHYQNDAQKTCQKRSDATSVTCGRAWSTMIDNLPVPAPMSRTRPVPDLRKLSVGREGIPFVLKTNRVTMNAAPNHRTRTPNCSISHFDHLRTSENQYRQSGNQNMDSQNRRGHLICAVNRHHFHE